MNINPILLIDKPENESVSFIKEGTTGTYCENKTEKLKLKVTVITTQLSVILLASSSVWRTKPIKEISLCKVLNNIMYDNTIPATQNITQSWCSTKRIKFLKISAKIRFLSC